MLIDVIGSVTTFEKQMVGALVASDFRTTDVFTQYGIDYCCGGQKTIGQACAELGIHLETLMEKVTQAIQNSPLSEQFNHWTLDLLSDYIVKQHHRYAKNIIPRISVLMKTVIETHGKKHPELRAVGAIWQVISEDLVMHMQKEELTVFPYIRLLIQSTEKDVSIPPPVFGSVAELIYLMEEEHQLTGDQLVTLAELSNSFTPPADACNTYQILYTYLADFQAMTKMHVYLENNILFPKAIALEKE